MNKQTYIVHWLSLLLLALLARGASAEDAQKVETKPRKRAFRFVYGATIIGLKPGQKTRIWIPLATDSPWQKVCRTATRVPGSLRETIEPRFKNRILYTEATANSQGEIPLEIVYEVERLEFARSNATALTAEDREKFIKASLKVPVDGTLQRRLLPQFLVNGALAKGTIPESEPITLGRTLYDVVNRQMRYDKPRGEPWGRGDAVWACDSGFGNCTDFHSLFTGLCRDLGIPAKFEIGFPIPTDSAKGEVGGYHCWAMFAESDRWVAVDISEADKRPELRDYFFGRLTPDRFAFTTGRDLRLVPAQQAGPLNFLVYPYVEVNGQPHLELRKQFRFEHLNR